MRQVVALLTLVALASCGRSGGPQLPATTSAASRPPSCYVVKQDPTTVNATITFYGWPDNSPPGNQIAHPVIHKHAGGDGTYCNPTTFATERSNDKQIPYGIKIYVPFLKQYFIREDLCAASGPTSGSGSNGCYQLWFDLWVGGTAKSKASAVIKCELELTPNDKVPVILWPDDGMPVAHAGPLYRNQPAPDGSCDGKREGG
jgi:predicted small lipoprotein YifL